MPCVNKWTEKGKGLRYNVYGGLSDGKEGSLLGFTPAVERRLLLEGKAWCLFLCMCTWFQQKQGSIIRNPTWL